MRYVKRTRPGPAVLRGKTAKAEIAAAHKHFKGRDKTKSFGFNVYKDKSVKQALLALFDGKCAYCEEILSGQPGDVEHFRPKSEISAGKDTIRPGYYWLACEWTNLFPSCRDCNGERTQEMLDVYRTAKGGKANQFPVGSKQRLAHPKKSGEKTVLLDPCRDRSENHLAFPTARQGVVIPRRSGASAARAQQTIDILGLNRKLLVIARRKTLELFDFALEGLRERHAEARKKKTAASRAHYAARCRELRAKVAGGQPFSECLRQVLEETIASLGPP